MIVAKDTRYDIANLFFFYFEPVVGPNSEFKLKTLSTTSGTSGIPSYNPNHNHFRAIAPEGCGNFV
jgi:hypothetical protein